MPFVNDDLVRSGNFALSRPEVFEIRPGGIAVESLLDACLYAATGYYWPTPLYRQGKSELRAKMPGRRPDSMEIYRRKNEAGEYEWTVLFVFTGDVEELRRRRLLFYNAELYVEPDEMRRVQGEIYWMRDERLRQAKEAAAKSEGGILT